MPSPNDMPGADKEPAVDTQEPTQLVDNSTDSRDASDDPDGLDAPVVTDPEAEISRLRNLVRRNRKWEDKARQNADKARKWEENADKVKQLEEMQAATRSKEETLQAERDRLQQELAAERLSAQRNAIAAETKVPARFITGSTETEMREAADEYYEAREREIEERLKALGVNPAAPASSVTSDGRPVQVRQLQRADLTNMSRKEVLAAEKAGQLDEMLGRTTN